ncbi:MAG: AI-2E family transporter [Paramuribaculum sp.]|nr:AI-2E family transporter [Paramuribaculum sp.]
MTEQSTSESQINHQPQHPRPTFWTTDRIMKLLIGLAIGGGVMWLLWRLSDVLLPFFAACVIAYMINPIVEFVQRKLHLRKRLLAVAITLLAILGVIVGLCYVFLPMITDELQELELMLKRYASENTFVTFLPPSVNRLLHNFSVENITRFLSTSHFQTLLSKGTSFVAGSLESLFHVLEWMLMFIYIIFVLMDYEQIVRGFKKIVPIRYRPQAMVIVADVQQNMSSYFRGQALIALFAAVFYCIGFSIVGLPLAIVMGLIVGILYMIPYFQYVTLIPVAIICFINSLGGDGAFWTDFGKCLLVYFIVQMVCDYVLTPHIMGKEMGLNPAVILLALSIWGSLLGVLGMIIALPATALLMSYYERYISNRGASDTVCAESTDQS